MSSAQLFAEIAVDGVSASANGGVLTYAVPPALEHDLGHRELVWAPLRSKLCLGLVVRLTADEPEFDVKPMHSRVEPVISVSSGQWELATWLARQTASSLFATASLFLPPGIDHRMVEWYQLHPEVSERSVDGLTPAQRTVIEILREENPLKTDTLRSRTGRKLTTVLPALEELGWIDKIPRVTSIGPNRKPDDSFVSLTMRRSFPRQPPGSGSWWTRSCSVPGSGKATNRTSWTNRRCELGSMCRARSSTRCVTRVSLRKSS